MNGNVIVGQSGGPTSVINSSLVGVFQGAKRAGCGKIYGMRNGLEGLLQERYVELNDCIKNDLDIEILKRTPSSFLGTCRYKLPHYEKDSAVYEKLFSILKKLDIKHFFYIGGNDSMDTIKKLAAILHLWACQKQSTTTLTKPTIHPVTEVRQNTLRPQ